ncbi:MAG: hypothetical protein WBG37_13935 [Desulfobacterales bacterium]
MNRLSKVIVAAVVMALVGFGVTGCSTLGAKKKPPQPVYYDFGDVLIPKELKYQSDQSFVQRRPDFPAGLLTFKGRVDRNSLMNFFDVNMAKDNWQPVMSFKSSRAIMLFSKQNRRCVIRIDEGTFVTQVEVWVAPTRGELGLEK